MLSNGSKAEQDDPTKPQVLGDRILRNGDEGADVKELQSYLIQLGYDCGRWGADGDFGDATELAVRAFQKDGKLLVDGEAGPNTIKLLLEKIGAITPEGKIVRIVGGNCYVRTAPNTSGTKLGVAHAGTTYKFIGETSPDGWLRIQYENTTGWVSGKYGHLE